MKIFKPESLNLEALFEINPPRFKYKIDIFYYLIYYILLNPYRTFNKQIVYVTLCSQGLQNNVHRDYNLYLEHLIQLEIIERLRAKQDDKCDNYRLGYDFLYDKLEAYTVTDFALKKRMRKENEHSKATMKKFSHLTKFLVDKDLTFDCILAYYEVQNKFELDMLDKDISVLRKYQFSLFNIRNFEENYMWIKNNPKNDNRLHTNITNMPKNLRKYLKFKGETLKAIDIKNSQPLMLLILIKTLRILNQEGGNRQVKGVIRRVVPNHILYILVKTAESLDIAELQRYEESVVSGKLYEDLRDEYFKNSDLKPPYTISTYDKVSETSSKKFYYNRRDFIKVKIFEIYFAKNKLLSKKPKSKRTFRKVFAELFPTIFELITEIKKENHVLLSKLMQQIESYLILERITKDIYAEYGFEQFTIHDSIGTRERNLKTLESAFKKRFFAETGIVPTIDIQDWGKEEEQLQRKAS